MKLQTRAYIGVVVVFAVLIVLITGVSARAFMRGLAAVERRTAEEVAHRAMRVVDAECDNLRRTARDYAEWDDTVAYVHAPNPIYENGNWTPASMGNVQVDAMLLFSLSGELKGGACVQAGTDTVTPPPPEMVKEFAAQVRAVAGHETGALRLAGQCAVGGRPAFFACLPILPTGGGTSPQGALVAVRWIDERLHDRLEQIMGFDISLTPASGRAAGPSGDTHVTLLSDHRISVAAPLRSADATPLLELRIEFDRVAFLEAVGARRMMFWQLLGVGIVAAGVFGWLLRTQVVRRLEQLSREVVAIGEQPNARGRVRVEGADEIASVARGINLMIEGLERADRERDHARKERELLQDQLLHAQKMEAVGEFAGGVAHDFNNCLTSIAGWLHLTKDELPADHTVQENILLALNSVEHASSVVRQLLTYSRHSEAPLTDLRLGELLTESLVLLRSGLPRSIQLHLHADGVDDHVTADRTQLLQVLMNLLNNARDAMGHKGTLTISLGEETLPSPTAAPANHLPPGAYVRLSVRDTGPGIPPDHLERIFKPFFTTKPAGKGTGLGLAVVQSVVARHNGAVWVESVPGEGATFHVLLPHRPPPAPTGGTRFDPGLHGVRVLLAEDDPAVARMLTTALKRCGCEVVAAEDGVIAWETLVLAERPFDIVLTDLTMPRLSGMQLVGKIVDSGRRTPVVLMTAYGATLDPEQLRQVGFAAVLSKPLAHDDVLLVLARVVGRSPPKR